MMKFLKNKMFIVVLLGLFAIFSITVIFQISRNNHFVEYDGTDAFDIIDTLE